MHSSQKVLINKLYLELETEPMFYKISNIANKETIEKKFKVKFEFPNLYKPQEIIEGLKEATVSIITLVEPKQVQYAIWGLLPENFEDNWSVFQDIFNTLNVEIDALDSNNDLYRDALENRRCIIIATGFFTTILRNGSVQRCHVHLSNYEPFAIAGIFNQLGDGFLTCSLLVTHISESFKEIPNISNLKPFVLNDQEIGTWLDHSVSPNEIHDLCEKHRSLNFQYEDVLNIN